MAEVDIGGDLVVLGADVALEVAEVDEVVVELAGRRIGQGGGEVDVEVGAVVGGEVLESQEPLPGAVS